MGDNMSYLSVPLVATPKYSVGPIIIAFVVIVIILGIIMYMFSNNPRYNDIRPKARTILAKISNGTKLPHKLSIPNLEDITLEPGRDVSLYVKIRDVIRAQAHNYDGEEINHNLTVTDNMDRIHITNDGMISSLGPFKTSDLENKSNIPVVFIQKTGAGRRWGMYEVRNNSVVVDKIVGAGSTWEVAILGDEDNPIDSIYISGVPTKIVFDGIKLTSY